MRDLRSIGLLILYLIIPNLVQSQDSIEREEGGRFEPYAGKYEPRIGGSGEIGGRNFRLDIGAGVELVDIPLSQSPGNERLVIGSEFFTWTRLRTDSGFKFPVEAVDYWFGLVGYLPELFTTPFPLGVHLRAAHISAHLVDGDPELLKNPDTAFTYSREFLDLKVMARIDNSNRQLTLYAGGVFLFNVIPDSLGRFSPVVGLDLENEIDFGLPLTARLGYELRLNTELTPIGEHSIRGGVQFSARNKPGLLIELGYYSGRSPFGQHFNKREEYGMVGIGIRR